jgi:glutamate-1-semialdehyde 2,1-aminomutase
MVQGHAHPAIVKAVRERVELGTHFAAPTEDGVAVAEELKRRWDLPRWRFVNSGSEATMDAIRIARAATGRDTIVKIFGSYHGHHDYVMVRSASRTTRSATASATYRCATGQASLRRSPT